MILDESRYSIEEILVYDAQESLVVFAKKTKQTILLQPAEALLLKLIIKETDGTFITNELIAKRALEFDSFSQEQALSMTQSLISAGIINYT